MAEFEAGWGWFSRQRGEGTGVICYRARLKDGDIDAASSDSRIDRDGRKAPPSLSDVELTPLATRNAPEGVVYPAR